MNLSLCVILAAQMGLAVFAAESSIPKSSDATRKESEFVAASTRGDLRTLSSMISQGVGVDSRNQDGLTALMLAAKRGDLETVQFLVENGASINARSNSKIGSSVLSFSMGTDSPEVARYLIGKGVDLDTHSRAGDSPLIFAILNQNYEFAELFLASGADPDRIGRDAEQNLLPPLMAAVARDDIRMIKLLLKHGASIDKRTATGWTALHYAAMRTNSLVVKVLVENGADVNAQERCDRTPLMLAAWFNHADNVRMLLKGNPDLLLTSPPPNVGWLDLSYPNVHSSYGDYHRDRKTAEEIAGYRGAEACEALLRDARRARQ